MINCRNPQSRTGDSIIACFLSSAFFLLYLTANVALASGEGSTSAPVLLGVDAPHQGSVGDIYSSFTSYYSFKTNEAGGYAIRLTNTHSNIAFDLFSDKFSTMVDDMGCDTTDATPNGDKTCVYNLAGNTYYYLWTRDWSFVSDSYTLTINDVKSEGSPGTPVPIADGASHGGMVDAGSSSYYSFTPTSSSAYTIAITNPNYYGYQYYIDNPLQINTYAGADFSTGLLRSCIPSVGAINCTVNGLTQGVPVYVKISEPSGVYSDTIFTVTPTRGIGEGSVAQPVALGVGTPHAGGVDAGSNLTVGGLGCDNPSYSYYTFNATAGPGGYTVATDNASTLPVRGELFQSFSGAYLGYCYSDQDSPCMFSGIEPNANYYLRITNCNGSIVNYNMLVKREGSEGSVNYPVPLPLETSHVGTIGYSETSYFTFTTDRSGTYNIILDDNLNWGYTSSPDFSGTYNIWGGTTTVNLDANKTYYLIVSNSHYPGIMSYTVKMVHGASEGSIANPVSLPMATPYSAKVGAKGTSYYTFTPPVAGDYYITFDNPTDLWPFIYTNPNFRDGDISSRVCLGPGPYFSCMLDNLSANTPYYMQTNEMSGVNAAFNIKFYSPDYLAGCSAGSECYNFENGSTTPFALTSTVTKGSAATKSLWAVDTTNNAATGGTKSLKSGTLVYSSTTPQYTCFEYTRTAPAHSVLFSLMVNAPSLNTLDFSIDGTVQPNGSFSTMPNWKRVMFFPTPGQHTYKWCFNENSPNATTPDSAWVDDIEFTDALVLVNSLPSFMTVQSAYATAADYLGGAPVLKARAVTFDGPFTFDRSLDATLQGGLDPTFTSTTGYSYLNGVVTIVNGSLTADNVAIR